MHCTERLPLVFAVGRKNPFKFFMQKAGTYYDFSYVLT